MEAASIKGCVIDFSFLRGKNGSLVPREVCLRAPEESRLEHWVLGEPYPESYLSPAQILQNKIRCREDAQLAWGKGSVPFKLLKPLLKEATAPYALLFAYGEEKARHLSMILDSRLIINIKTAYDQAYSEHNEPGLAFQTMCMLHAEKNRKMCTINKCLSFSNFLVQYHDKLEIENGSIKMKKPTRNRYKIESAVLDMKLVP